MYILNTMNVKQLLLNRSCGSFSNLKNMTYIVVSNCSTRHISRICRRFVCQCDDWFLFCYYWRWMMGTKSKSNIMRLSQHIQSYVPQTQFRIVEDGFQPRSIDCKCQLRRWLYFQCHLSPVRPSVSEYERHYGYPRAMSLTSCYNSPLVQRTNCYQIILSANHNVFFKSNVLIEVSNTQDRPYEQNSVFLRLSRCTFKNIIN